LASVSTGCGIRRDLALFCSRRRTGISTLKPSLEEISKGKLKLMHGARGARGLRIPVGGSLGRCCGMDASGVGLGSRDGGGGVVPEFPRPLGVEVLMLVETESAREMSSNPLLIVVIELMRMVDGAEGAVLDDVGVGAGFEEEAVISW
jgi:hypothetical protein